MLDAFHGAVSHRAMSPQQQRQEKSMSSGKAKVTRAMSWQSTWSWALDGEEEKRLHVNPIFTRLPSKNKELNPAIR